MSRQDRLREYSKPLRAENWQGSGRDQAHIDRWSARATENSKLAPRAYDGPQQLPSTGKRQEMRSTSSRPYRAKGEEDGLREQAKADMNIEGDSLYLRGIRRNA